MSDLKISLDDAIAINVTAYGIPIENGDVLIKGSMRNRSENGFTDYALIQGFRYGNGKCVRLPKPIILYVAENGSDLTNSECGFQPNEVLKWSIAIDTNTHSVDLHIGTIEEILALAIKGVDGGLQILNPRFVGTKICADIHVWASIEYFGRRESFDETFPICIELGCYPVWTYGGWATVEACFREPNKIYAKLCVGKWGIDYCWETPEYPIPINKSQVDHSDCNCKSLD